MSNLGTAIANKMESAAQRIASAKVDSDRLATLKKNVGKVVVIPIREIDDSQNIRKGPIDTESPKFKQLVESIKRDGLLQNIVVELREDSDGYRLVCLAGHRRIRAMLALGNERITSLLLEKKSAAGGVSAALSENQNRENLHFLDVAEGYLELTNQGWTKEELSAHYERDEKTIRRYLKMAAWSERTKNFIRENSERLSLRIIIHEFVNKSFKDEDALFEAIKLKALPSRKGATGKGTKESVIRQKLKDFYQTRSDVTVEMQGLIEEALKYAKVFK